MGTPLFLDRFFYLKDQEKTLDKLHSFINSGKNKVHLLLDFERTLTQGRDRSGKDLTIWGALKNLLSENSRSEYDQLYEKYRALEVKNKLSETDAIKWWGSILTLYKENKINLPGIERATGKIKIRPYTKQLFKICEDKNIPTIIISAGIKNIIELFCKKEGIHPTAILSTEFTFSPGGYINGWKPDSLIHILNKKERGHEEIKGIKSARPKAVIIGDSLNDAFMVDGENNVLRIAIPDPRHDDRHDKFQEFFKNFDLVIKGKTLYPVIKILDLL